MTARRCFKAKMGAGKVDARAGAQVLDMLDQFEREYQSTLGDGAAQRQAALDAAKLAKAEAARRADETTSAIRTQADILRRHGAVDAQIKQARATPGSFGFGNKAPPGYGGDQSTWGLTASGMLTRDIYGIGQRYGANVQMVAQAVKDRAQTKIYDMIEALRPKFLGLVDQTTLELDFLRAGLRPTAANISEQAKAWWTGWIEGAKIFHSEYRRVGGVLGWMDNYFPNPSYSSVKVNALGYDRFSKLVDDNIARDRILDWSTGERMNDARYEMLKRQVYETIRTEGAVQGTATGEFKARRMLANSRDYQRVLQWRDDEAWIKVAEAIGTHASPYRAMFEYMEGMSRDIGMMAVFGKNPENAKRFIHRRFAEEPGRLAVEAASDSPKDLAAAVRRNERIRNNVKNQERRFENVWAEMTGANRIPTDVGRASIMGEARAFLVSTDLGSALLSSLTDPFTAMLAARMNALPIMNLVGETVRLLATSKSEILAAQHGLAADSLAFTAHQTDKIMGEQIHGSYGTKAGSAIIRGSGLRAWTANWRASYGLNTMYQFAREAPTEFDKLNPTFRASLERYGIGEGDWNLIRAVAPEEIRPGAKGLRPMDVWAVDTPGHRVAAEKFSRLVNTEMSRAVIDRDPLTRAILIGQSRPGTGSGEIRAAAAQYRGFATTFMTMHMAQYFDKGWDGTRLGAAAMGFITMTIAGVLAMQAREIAMGRDPLSLNPTTLLGLRGWGKAALQGGGLGIFGDLFFVDQTRHGNTWAAAIMGTLPSHMESVLGDFLMKNVQLAAKGEKTHWAGDALYVAAKHLPGSSLWYGRLAFQRAVLDELAKMIDPRTPERHRRMERNSKRDWGQDYWWRPGQARPERPPNMRAIGGVR